MMLAVKFIKVHSSGTSYHSGYPESYLGLVYSMHKVISGCANCGIILGKVVAGVSLMERVVSIFGVISGTSFQTSALLVFIADCSS